MNNPECILPRRLFQSTEPLCFPCTDDKFLLQLGLDKDEVFERPFYCTTHFTNKSLQHMIPLPPPYLLPLFSFSIRKIISFEFEFNYSFQFCSIAIANRKGHVAENSLSIHLRFNFVRALLCCPLRLFRDLQQHFHLNGFTPSTAPHPYSFGNVIESCARPSCE